MLDLLDFGKGILATLPKIQAGTRPTTHVVSKPFNIGELFLNNNHWLLYVGTDTNIPCGATKFLISYEPISITFSQLKDFSETARPDFSIKPIGERRIFENKKTNREELQKMRDENNKNNKVKQKAEK
jgi:hypothetical protein